MADLISLITYLNAIDKKIRMARDIAYVYWSKFQVIKKKKIFITLTT